MPRRPSLDVIVVRETGMMIEMCQLISVPTPQTKTFNDCQQNVIRPTAQMEAAMDEVVRTS